MIFEFKDEEELTDIQARLLLRDEYATARLRRLGKYRYEPSHTHRPDWHCHETERGWSDTVKIAPCFSRQPSEWSHGESYADGRARTPENLPLELWYKHEEYIESLRDNCLSAVSGSNASGRISQKILERISFAICRESFLEIGELPEVSFERESFSRYPCSCFVWKQGKIVLHVDNLGGVSQQTILHEYCHWFHHECLSKHRKLSERIKRCGDRDWSSFQEHEDVLNFLPKKIFRTLSMRIFKKDETSLTKEEYDDVLGISDCICEMSVGKFGMGHDSAYIRQKNREGLFYCESLANLGALSCPEAKRYAACTFPFLCGIAHEMGFPR